MGTDGDDPTTSSFTLPERPGALREPSPRDADAGRLPNGATLGRYVVTGCVGTGGMGMVYSARDPDLDRNVALKVLRPELSVEVRSRARLLGEARAMAQLSHPNVVPVYDVGVLDDHVFIAMELVDGVTLRHKLDRATPWRTVVEIYLQAARGLAAAHAAGLVHRDFKPDNVLYGTDGRIRVVDFGLVAADPLDTVPPGSPSRGSISSGIETTAGVVLGTPAFMAPEAMRGEVTDPRADQFSFCVAVFHGLYGEYPHTGATLAERADQIALGAVKRLTGTQVPDRVFRILVRGLQSRPEDRYASMTELIEALEHAIRPRRRRIVAIVAAAVALTAIPSWALLHDRGAPAPPVSFGPAETIAHTEDQQLEVSMLRDGRYVHVERGVVTVVTADGSRATELAAPAGVVPSHVRASVEGWAEIRTTAAGKPCAWWLVPVDGGAWNHLLDDPSCASEIALSPDGTKLAVTTGGVLKVRTIATGAEQELMKLVTSDTDTTHVPSWSPDGTRLAVDGDIKVIDAATGKALYDGRSGAAVAWLDANRLVYAVRDWLHSEIRVVDLRTRADTAVTSVEGNVGDLVPRPGAVLVRRNEFHSRAHIVSTTATSPARVDDLPQLDTGSSIDFRTAMWTDAGAVVTVALVAGQRGLVSTMPGQRGTPLVLDRARNITATASNGTVDRIIYVINDGPDCDARVFDLTTGKVQSWRTARCQQRPYVTCARSQPRCVVVDDLGSRWFNPQSLTFDGDAQGFRADEILSPDAQQAVRVDGSSLVIRSLATGAETPIAVPAPGKLDVVWGKDAQTQVVVATEGTRRQMLVHTGERWRTIIDEPHRMLNGYVVSPDGSRVAMVALFTTSTWSLLPIDQTSS